ncbi:HAMP domain-containing sensor histidine kinase [uncultured Gemella sp.]|uniref:sensor histidine kinase n=1 Tax=uncultured Gemella sp. TaxID=254352 RepID=UPI0028D87109|nr:HAMP domain-containing sensor histidine kinase [uncultured Gemella sp.]
MLNKNKKLLFFPFKKVSLTFKITLWYTTFIVLLIGSLIIGTFFVSDSVVESEAKKRLIDEVVEISSGADKFTPYEDGVTLSVYDKDGNLVAGSVPRNFKVNDFSLGAISEYKDVNHNKYLYYDSETSSARLGNGKYVRGIVQVTNNINGWILPIIISIGSPFIIMIIMYGGYLIIKSSLKPVRDMTKTAEAIANSNDLSKRIYIEEGNDEVHKLGKVFNEMLETLENSSKRERQFSSDVSHELRTPISVIMAESEYGSKYIDSIEEAKESFSAIERQSKRMTSMINQILELARLDSRLEIPKQKFQLSDKIKHTLEDYKILFDNKNIKLSITIEENISIYANEALIMRMIDNLLSNALKYAETEVTVCLAKRNRIIFEVADDGIGINDEEKINIWNRFYKVDKSRTTTEDNSSGLGLSITKKIVELHNGKIAIIDNKPNGTRFVVNL